MRAASSPDVDSTSSMADVTAASAKASAAGLHSRAVRIAARASVHRPVRKSASATFPRSVLPYTVSRPNSRARSSASFVASIASAPRWSSVNAVVRLRTARK